MNITSIIGELVKEYLITALEPGSPELLLVLNVDLVF